MARRTRRIPYWEHVGWIDSSSEPGQRHEIKRHINTGLLGCDCMAYRFTRVSPKTCRHLDAWAAGVNQITAARRQERRDQQTYPSRVSRPSPTVTATVTMGNTTFTLSAARSISFDTADL